VHYGGHNIAAGGALIELATWFHAMDHTNYARWIPVPKLVLLSKNAQ